MNTCIRPAHVSDRFLQFPFFYHMTHKDNLAGILQHGILSHSDVLTRDDVLATDISDAGAQRWRDRVEPANHRAIHDYAPLYLNPKNPMLFVRRNLQHEIVILKISPGVLQDSQHVFADGNAASRETRFSSNSNVIADSLTALKAEYWANCTDGKRRRCAELLVYPKVKTVHILSAICSNNALAREIATGTDLQIEVNPSMFF
jgi:hypothetical protein